MVRNLPSRRIGVHRIPTLFLICIGLFPGLLGAQTAGDPQERIILDPVESTPTATDEAAAQIIANHLRFVGGSTDLAEARERIRRVKALRQRGELREGNLTWEIVMDRAAPNRIRLETFRTHLGWRYHRILGSNGEEQWGRDLLPERTRPQPLGGGEARPLVEYGNLYGPFLDHAEHGLHFTYGGIISLAGRTCFLLHGYHGEDEIRHYYIDQERYLLMAVAMEEDFSGRPAPVERYYTRHALVEGIYLPSAWIYRSRGNEYRSVRIHETESNPEFPETHFDPPHETRFLLRSPNQEP